MQGRPHVPLMSAAIVLICTAAGLHLACMHVPYYAVIDDFKCLALRVATTALDEDQLVKALTNLKDKDDDSLGRVTQVLDSVHVHFGLWELCVEVTLPFPLETCRTFTSGTQHANSTMVDVKMLRFMTPDWLYGCQIASITAAILLGLTLGHFIIICILPRTKLADPMIASVIATVAGISILAANLVFILKKDANFLLPAFQTLMQTFKEEKIQTVTDMFTESLKTGAVLNANMASPFLAFMSAAALALVASRDSNRQYGEYSHSSERDTELEKRRWT